MMPRFHRRDAHRLAAGAGLLAGLGPAAGRAAVSRVDGQGSPLFGAPAIAPLAPAGAADNFGVNEAFRAPHFGQLAGAGWTRWTVQWFNVQPRPGDLNVHYFRDHRGRSVLEETVRSGMKVAAMVLGTPEWAATVPGLKTGTSVPRGLYDPVFLAKGQPNPDNTWGAFMFDLAQSYRGLLDVLEIWNEVEIPPAGSNALYHTWAGTPAEYFQLLKVAWQAVKAANSRARIVTSPYAYFRDKQEGRGVTLPWFDAFADAVRADPVGAGAFDVFALNSYYNPHDIWDRANGGVPDLVESADSVGFRARLRAIGAAGKPIWLAETNSAPYDDDLPGWDAATRDNGFRITMDEQASYVLQAYALALAAGYEKVFFQALQDDPYPVPDELWGLVRFHDDRLNGDDARLRPAFVAYQLAARYLGDADWVQLLVRRRPDPRAYRQYASRFEWAVHLVVFQKGTQRASVLWNGTGEPALAGFQAWGASARVVDKYGQEVPLAADAAGILGVTLEPARRHFQLFGGDPPGYYYVGGSPLIVVEDGVPPDAAVEAPGFQPVPA